MKYTSLEVRQCGQALHHIPSIQWPTHKVFNEELNGACSTRKRENLMTMGQNQGTIYVKKISNH